MPRLTISLPDNMHHRLSALAIQNEESMSTIINRLILVGMRYLETNQDVSTNALVEKHCHQLIIQMNALIKNISAEVLKFNSEDFEQLQKAASLKYDELNAR